MTRHHATYLFVINKTHVWSTDLDSYKSFLRDFTGCISVCQVTHIHKSWCFVISNFLSQFGHAGRPIVGRGSTEQCDYTMNVAIYWYPVPQASDRWFCFWIFGFFIADSLHWRLLKAYKNVCFISQRYMKNPNICVCLYLCYGVMFTHPLPYI